ncbi:Serine/threonine receptor-like kinase NFP [Linum perenne]
MNFSEAINRPVLVPVTRLPVLRQINPSSRRAKNSKLHWIIAIIAVEPTTPKFDVFAFGVVLLELLSGNKAIVTEENGEIVLLSKEIKTVLEVAEKRVENLRNWMDPNMENLYPIDGALSLAMLARACTLEKSSARPSMAEVVFNLTVLTQSPTDSLEEAWPTKLQGEEILHICSPLTAR